MKERKAGQTRMNIIFIVSLILFAVVLVLIGVLSRKQVSDSSDFILAGRGIGFWMNVLNTISIGFAGTSIAFNPGFTVMFGFRDSLVYSVIVALIGYGGYGLICGKFVRTCGAQTLAEWMETRYDSKTRNIISIGGIIGLCGILANNIVSMVGTIAGYTGWPTWAITTVSYLVILSFAYFAGMWGVSITGFFQMILGIVIVPLFCILCLTKFGGLEFISANWQGNFWSNGIGGGSMPRLSVAYPSYFSLLILFGFFLIWGSNYYWGRLASCRNEKTAKNSFATAGLLMMIIFYCTLSFIGLYAGALKGDVFVQGGGTVAATAAYGVLAALFPDLISTLIIIAAITASVSTGATSLMGATATASRDLYGRLINPRATGAQKLKATRVIIVLVTIFTWIIGLYPGGPTYLFAFSTAWLGPPAILLCLGMFWRRFNAKGAFWGTVAGIVSMSVLTVLDLTGVIPLSANTHVGLIGFVVTIVVAVAVCLLTPPPYYGARDWDLHASANNREQVQLEELDLKLLALIRDGYTYLSDLVDALDLDAGEGNRCIERLDRGGYIEREGLTNFRFNCFHITEKGISQLPALTDHESKLNQNGLSAESAEVLCTISRGEDALIRYVKEKKYSSLKMSSILTHLVRTGYITDKGLVKAHYKLTEKGLRFVQEVK